MELCILYDFNDLKLELLVGIMKLELLVGIMKLKLKDCLEIGIMKL